jgi:hypothetical protein
MYVCMSVGLHRTTRLLHKVLPRNLIFEFFFQNLSRKFKCNENLARITGTLHDDLSTFMILRWILVSIKNISDKCRTEDKEHNFVFNNSFFFDNRAVHEIMWKHKLLTGHGWQYNMRMRFACWMSKAPLHVFVCLFTVTKMNMGRQVGRSLHAI